MMISGDVVVAFLAAACVALALDHASPLELTRRVLRRRHDAHEQNPSGDSVPAGSRLH